jgi:hypothetical protein
MTEMPLPHECLLCGQPADEVLLYQEDGRCVRAGWLCTTCWPQEGAWNRAILRERTVQNS